MAEPMPTGNPFLEFPYAPIRMECESRDLIVEGAVPAELNGTFYRAGPNQRFRPRGDYHLFQGDGMVHAFHIRDGRVDYRNRWVRTAKWKHEDRAGRALVNPMNPFDCDPEFSDFVFTDKDGSANTAVVWHGGRMLVMEEGHPPFEIDPLTLESLGSWNYRGKLHSAMTAHPKIDPLSGEMVFFAYMATGPFAADVMVHKVSADGVLRESVLIPTPYSAMVHDFVITADHILIPVFPLTGSLDRAMAGGPPFAWEPEKGGFLGVLPRRAGATAADVRWIPMDPPFAFHFMNAFEDGSVITIDACQFEHAPLFPTADGTSMGRAKPLLSRWRCDLAEAEPRVRSEVIGGIEAEFPQCDPRVVGGRYRHGWYTAPDGGLKSALAENENMYNTIGHYDHETGREQRYSCGKASVSEAIFVPRAPDAPEGDGYLLSVATSFETRTSSLYVFDAQRVADGPLARAQLSHYVPVGFHGGWRPAG